jgi:hypothetical protein
MDASFATNINYIDAAGFSGSGTSEARLNDLGGGVQILEIDADGDGFITGNT